MNDYKRKVILNKENDELNEIMRRKAKRKKRKIAQQKQEVEKNFNFIGESDENYGSYEEEPEENE